MRFFKRLIPTPLFRVVQPTYHFLLAAIGALYYRFPSKKLVVIGVTGTKGKSSTVELINSIFEEAGYTTAVLSTIRFKVSDNSLPNRLKMTMPGRFFVQSFLNQAHTRGCTHAIIEMTSEGVKQFRHRFIDLDALVFTNIEPEHIESHGSFENYLNAKLKLRDLLERSSKQDTALVANSDDSHGKEFLKVRKAKPIPFSLSKTKHRLTNNGIEITYNEICITSPLEGAGNAANILAAIKIGEHFSIPLEAIQKGIEKVEVIPGRFEHIDLHQAFDVVVDYAHTPQSLEQLYQTFKDKHKICVLGNTGGGRDTWKRPEMGRIAEEYCARVILTNEDPYDEDPEKILRDMTEGMKSGPTIILDRREAMRTAFTHAKKYPGNTVVLITGKGTDPYIMEAEGVRTPWSDARVAQEELERLQNS